MLLYKKFSNSKGHKKKVSIYGLMMRKNGIFVKVTKKVTKGHTYKKSTVKGAVKMINQKIRDTVLKELNAARLSSARAYVLLKKAGLSEKDNNLIAFAAVSTSSVYNLIRLSMENEPRTNSEDLEI